MFFYSLTVRVSDIFSFFFPFLAQWQNLLQSHVLLHRLLNTSLYFSPLLICHLKERFSETQKDEAFWFVTVVGPSCSAELLCFSSDSKWWVHKNQRNPFLVEWLPFLCKWLQCLLANVYGFWPFTEIQSFWCLQRCL